MGAGCIPGEFTPSTSLNDLSFVSVEAVPQRDAADRQTSVYDEPHFALLKVRFTTATDFAAFTRSHARSIHVSAKPCRDKENLATYVFDTNVYDRYGELARDDRAQAAREKAGGSRGDYHFYIAVVAPQTTSEYAHYTPYDLTTKPEDICAFVHGGGPSPFGGINVPPFRFSTNDVVIPEAAIRAALTAAGG